MCPHHTWWHARRCLCEYALTTPGAALLKLEADLLEPLTKACAVNIDECSQQLAKLHKELDSIEQLVRGTQSL